jgi:hypothetical protein
MGARNPLNLHRRAATVMWLEAVAVALGPTALIFLCYATLALFGFGGATTCTGFMIVAALALGHGLRGFSAPARSQIERRIERASGLKHRPFATVTDTPAVADPLALALWRAHQSRVASSLASARTGGPDFQVTARDPYALRGLLLLLLLTGLVSAGPAAQSRLTGAFVLPAWPFPGPSVDAWITPPSYAAAPPLVLEPGQAVTTLAGSQLTIIINGPSRMPLVSFAGANFAGTTLSPNSHRLDGAAAESGRLLIGPWWHRLGAWTITVVAPTAPSIHLASLTPLDRSHFRLNWLAQDRYGLATVTATLTPIGYPHALPEPFPLDPNGHSARLDIANSPYGGLTMNITLTARNVANVTATAAPNLAFGLAASDLTDLTAIKLAGLRQRLALEPAGLRIIGAALRQVASFPPSLISYGADLQLAALASTMAAGETGAQDAVNRLGDLIAEIEAGPDYAPGRALAQADQALLNALQQGLNGHQMNHSALQNLLQAMHQALARHLAAIAPPSTSPLQGQQIDVGALDRLAQKIADDEAAGRTEQAADELRRLQAAFDALQSAQPLSAGQAAQAQAAAQAAQTLSALTTGEAEVLDGTHRGTATPGEQQTLSDGLQSVEHALRDSGINLPGMADAGRAMADAQTALAQSDSGRAEQSESAAIQGLQRATAALAASASMQLSIGNGFGNLPQENPTGESANGAPDEQTVPGLGIPTGNAADAIQQQIIRQDADPNLPPATHQYFDRLLNPDQ